ncbi:hypothetical protein A2U01_0070317, partial [Trifolium medium]|nr:hypothetical protein [Trifolium medium]
TYKMFEADLGLVRPKFEAEPRTLLMMLPGDTGARQARCALHISPVLACRPETY